MGEVVHSQETIERQILAMEVAYFDIATRRKNGSTSVHDGLVLTQLWGLIDRLREQNRAGQAVLIRPHGEHGMSLISGLSYVRMNELKIQGFEPALVVQYGTDLFQAWLKHDRKLDKETGERVAKCLAERAGGEIASAHWDSFGYLANFLLPDWLSETGDEVRLIEYGGKVYSNAAELLSKFCGG